MCRVRVGDPRLTFLLLPQGPEHVTELTQKDWGTVLKRPEARLQHRLRAQDCRLSMQKGVLPARLLSTCCVPGTAVFHFLYHHTESSRPSCAAAVLTGEGACLVSHTPTLLTKLLRCLACSAVLMGSLPPLGLLLLCLLCWTPLIFLSSNHLGQPCL